MQQSDLNQFFAAAQRMCLRPDEEARAWEGIHACMQQSASLEPDEVADVRSILASFTQDYPLQPLVPLLNVGPLMPWTGVNLFGHLQPFCV